MPSSLRQHEGSLIVVIRLLNAGTLDAGGQKGMDAGGQKER